jgi:hypothetical protein
MDGQCIININGKSVGVMFNKYGVEQAGKVKGNISLYKNIVAQVWGGILGYAFAEQVDPPVKFGEVVEWIDELNLSDDSGEFKKVNDAFLSSRVYKSQQPKEEAPVNVEAVEKALADEEEAKKKATTTTLDSSLPAS